MSKKYRLRLLIHIGLIAMLWGTTTAQNLYELQFDLTSVDTVASVACYDMQFRNVGPDDWALGGANISIFYDANVGRLIDSTIKVVNDPNDEYGLGVLTNLIFPNVYPSLPYGDSAGYFRLSVTVNLAIQGIIIPKDSTWVSFANMCFDLLVDDITSPATCFQVNFRTEIIAGDLAVPLDAVQELVSGGPGPNVDRSINRDLIPDKTKNSCFILEEDTEDLCSDGIDNDEDGLIDCMDSGCGAFCTEDTAVTCGDGIDNDLDGLVDCMDTECSAFCAEDSAVTCGDGIDNDLDGLIDCQDDGCHTMYQSFTPLSPINCPDLNNGALELTFSIPNVEVSIDSGLNYMASTTITGLSPGTYNIFYRNTITNCVEESLFNPFVLDASQDCTEDTEGKCSDGVDNDDNGLLDCEEATCQTFNNCIVLTESSTGECQDGIDNDEDGLVDCNDSDCRLFNFCASVLDSLLYVPTVFSRGGIEIGNQKLIISAKEDLELLDYRIYDRGGNMVFEKTNTNLLNPEIMWDGTYDNKAVASGVYIYILRVVKDNETYIRKGDVTVLK